MEKKTVEVEVKFNIGDHAWIRTGKTIMATTTCPTCGGSRKR